MKARNERQPNIPRVGQILRLTRAASPQFIEPIVVLVRRVVEWTTYEGWIWLDVYQLGPDGHAVEERRLFLRLAGLQLLQRRRPDAAARRARNQARNGRATDEPRKPPDRDRYYSTADGRRLI